MRPVIITTKHRGVFFGYVEGETVGKDPIELKGAKMAIRWGTTRGLMELAAVGPNPQSKISLPADMEVRDVTAVFEVTPEAEAKWKTA